MRLTANQYDSMCSFNQHVGETVDVLTSEYTAHVNPAFVKRAVGGYHSASALRGLERKGFIRINDSFWKGANITILSAADLSIQLGGDNHDTQH
jgi:hypothetical protein